MAKKVQPKRPSGNSTRGKRFKNIKDLREAVHAQCWAELAEAFGEGNWKEQVKNLPNFLAEANETENRSRELHAQLRSILLDIVAAGHWHSAAQSRHWSGKAGRPENGECIRLLRDSLAPALLPLLKHDKMAVSQEWFALLEAPQDYTILLQATAAEKRRPFRWEMSKRSRLVDMLDRLNMLDLPPRSDGTGSSRFLNEREFALLNLLLDIGVLDEGGSVSKKLSSAGFTAAEVVNEEVERMRLTLKRHGRDAKRRQDRESSLRARCKQEGREPTAEELAAVRADGTGPIRGPG